MKLLDSHFSSRPLQDDDLLITKLVSLQPPPSLVSRRQLLKRLNDSFQHKLTLICAPAGFGKTTLLSEWLAQMPHPITWLSLDPGDSDPQRFWRYVIAACQRFQEGVGVPALEHLLECQIPRYEVMLTRLMNDIIQLPGQYGLILEDYHVIESGEIHQAMTFLLDHLPSNLHLIVTTRREPPLPLAKLRARGELGELSADELRFSTQEIRDFLAQTVPATISESAIERLQGRTEGWAAGLRLAALSLQNKHDSQAIEQFLETFSGSHQHITDYLFAEVFSTQPEAIQAFLLRTAFLSRLSGDFCDAVTGRNDSSGVLKVLESANLFLIPLEGTWYRYHALFGEALQHYAKQVLDEAALQTLYRNASYWYESHGFVAEAIEAALLAGEFDAAAKLIMGIVKPFYLGNEYHTLRRWIDCLPAEVRNSHPTIALIYVAAILFTSDQRTPNAWAQAYEPLEVAEAYWQKLGDPAKLGEVMVFRGMVEWWQGNFEGAFQAVRTALKLLPADDVPWRGMLLIGVSFEETLKGHLDVALPAMREALALCEASGNFDSAYIAMQTLGELSYARGEMYQAERYYRQLLAITGSDDYCMNYRAQALIGLGTLAYEWNDLKLAEQHIQQGLEIGKRLSANLEEIPGKGVLVQARLLHLRGESRKAQQLLNTLAIELRHPHLLLELRFQQIRLALAVGDMTTAQHCLSTVGHANDIPPIYQEQAALISVRLLILQGDFEAALQVLNPWQEDTHQHERMRSELEMMLLKGIAYHKQGHTEEAYQLMQHALELAQFEGYRRLFLDEGEPVFQLLHETLPHLQKESLAGYARSLLVAFSSEAAKLGSTSLTAVKPLSRQEERILHLLAEGLSNAEIAQQLVVSINTIKTQIKSIFRKLNVTTRAEAADVARQLK
jgi:LuxR family transcriptional regulator, maltose regulon positive regulatory protein